jgi:hypothetical protein
MYVQVLPSLFVVAVAVIVFLAVRSVNALGKSLTWIFTWHGQSLSIARIKIVNANLACCINKYRNVKEKLLTCNANLYFNKSYCFY